MKKVVTFSAHRWPKGIKWMNKVLKMNKELKQNE